MSADRCRARGFHEFVMGYVDCRVCGAPDPSADKLIDVVTRLRDTRACATCGGFRLFTARLLNRDYCRKCDPVPQVLAEAVVPP